MNVSLKERLVSHVLGFLFVLIGSDEQQECEESTPDMDCEEKSQKA